MNHHQYMYQIMSEIWSVWNLDNEELFEIWTSLYMVDLALSFFEIRRSGFGSRYQPDFYLMQ